MLRIVLILCVSVLWVYIQGDDNRGSGGPAIFRWRPNTSKQGVKKSDDKVTKERVPEKGSNIEATDDLPEELLKFLKGRYSDKTIIKMKEMRDNSEWRKHKYDLDLTTLQDMGKDGRDFALRPHKTKFSEEQLKWWRSLGAGFGGSRRRKRAWWNSVMKRREYRTLSREERLEYHRALWATMNTKIGNLSQYEMFVQFHQQDWSPFAHFGSSFLPWHREFLFRFELILQSHSPKTALPYWDSRLDRHLPNPRHSIMFSDEFMGDPDGLVTTGPFKYWPVLPRCRIGNNKTILRLGTDMTAESLYQDSDVEYVMSRSSFEDLVIPNILEWEHGGPHVYMGGQMGNITCSPSDPIFWTHHSFIDSIFQKFREGAQKTDIQNEYPEHANMTTDIGGVGHNPRAQMFPFEPLVNKDGLMTFYTDFFYNYEPHPVRCKNKEDCGRYLWCRNGRCMSKVKLGGNCTGFPTDIPDPCECGTCIKNVCTLGKNKLWDNCKK